MTLCLHSWAYIPLIPLLVGLVVEFTPNLSPRSTARYTAAGSLLTCLGVVVAGFLIGHLGRLEADWLALDRLNVLMAGLIACISFIVHCFSINYMQAEGQYKRYFIELNWLVAAILLFVSANHTVLLGAAWVAMSFAMWRLLRHKHAWKPAQQAARLALQTFLIGYVFFLVGFACLCQTAHSLELSTLITTLANHATTPLETLGLGFIAVAALTKSANIPFFAWLPNTMTAPTPVSAIMHAGFVNSGGFLLSLLSPLYARHPELLMGLFWMGGLSALFGVLAMMVQSDIKRYLAFSTIGQMGFMIMQCGLGAFPAAMIHIVTHGFLKASLFLGTGSTIQFAKELPAKRLSLGLPAIGMTGILSLLIIGLAWQLDLLTFTHLDDWLTLFILMTALTLGLLSTRVSTLPWWLTLSQGMVLPIVVLGMYILLEGVAYHWLFPTTRHAGLPIQVEQIALMAGLWGASLTVVNAPQAFPGLHKRLYAWLLSQAQHANTFTIRSTTPSSANGGY